MMLPSLFKRSKTETVPEPVAEPIAPKRSVVTLGVDENGRYRGIFKDERIHMAVLGFPGYGKSRFLLSLALQNVRDGDGLMIIDPHGDLVKIFLSHIPKHRWKDVIYIDPVTARTCGKVVKINFLECPDVKDRDVVARSFMESLEKVYARFWGPRLDMILMNAVYALLDAGNTNLSMLYNVIADEEFRETLLEKVADDKIKNFWRNEFKRMTKDASSAALTKIYRIVQERIVAPIFDCIESKINFREAMDQRKIIVVNLSEGAITSDVANFLGSLILSRVYLAGMSREDTPEEKRVPFYVYVDEAYRFVSLSIRDILQSLRKYRVYMTLASQFLDQYNKEIAASIPHLCDAIICFAVGEETAKVLEEFYKPSLTYLDLVHLPKYAFAASVIIGGTRECQVLRNVDCGWGPVNIEELIKFSLERYGENVDMTKYTGVPTVASLPHPTNAGFYTPIPWAILVELNKLCEEDPRKRFISREDLAEKFVKFGISDVEFEHALRALSTKNYIESKEHNYDFECIPVSAEPPITLAPVICLNCQQPTCRPFRVRGGRVYCRHCIERLLYTGDVYAADVIEPEIDPRTIRRDKVFRRRTTKRFYAITPIAKNKFFERVPRGTRGGGTEHARAIGAIERVLLRDYCYCEIDLGEETPKITADGKEGYEAKSLPDIVAYPAVRGWSGKLDLRHWDSGRAFTVEVEIDPIKHRQRVINNFRKNRERWGLPVIFATIRPKWANDLVDILHNDLGAKVVVDNTGRFGGTYDPQSVSVLHIDPETECYNFVTVDARMPVKEEDEQQKPDDGGKAAETRAAELGGRVETVEQKPSKDKPAEDREAMIKAAVEFQLEDPNLLPLIFSREPWLFRRRFEGDVQILYAECRFMGKLARVKLGPYEQFRQYFELTGRKPPLVPEEEKSEGSAPETTAGEKPVEAKIHGEAEKQPCVATPTIEAAEQLVDLQVWRSLSPEDRLRLAARLQYKFHVRKRGGRLELYAQKWVPSRGKPDKPYIGLLDEKLKKIAGELKIEIPSLNQTSEN